MTAKLEKGEGSVGQLLNNDSLYDNINKAAASLDRLLEDVKAHPSRYINITIFNKKKKK